MTFQSRRTGTRFVPRERRRCRRRRGARSFALRVRAHRAEQRQRLPLPWVHLRRPALRAQSEEPHRCRRAERRCFRLGLANAHGGADASGARRVARDSCGICGRRLTTPESISSGRSRLCRKGLNVNVTVENLSNDQRAAYDSIMHWVDDGRVSPFARQLCGNNRSRSPSSRTTSSSRRSVRCRQGDERLCVSSDAGTETVVAQRYKNNDLPPGTKPFCGTIHQYLRGV